ncbi:dynamin family protein [Ectobacillus ponti]|uniref:Dynamin family protein n=1 Tax=Ectobacillus ponti TaxID=2961894 RepID=A0AA42BRH5_9BACI|nr:dynamin family protein [Ectobacillus ponti]MCP8970947.1 dynamin family protein [Ectobacillus ponti]
MVSLLDERFYAIADKYIPIWNEDGTRLPYASYFSHKLTNLQKDEFLIPILGVQGTGKSSLLNALLMDDIVLPVDADETTCIPVEVRYSSTHSGRIEVHFSQASEIKVIQSPKELEQYVHNAYNPGNQKGVSHIVVYRDNDILRNGVVFVDLPGVSSLTQKNMQTTMNYIDRLSAAIFLLRTVPPITRSEMLFLSTVWPKLTKVWFVQNQWNDESKREVQDGLEHNRKVLEKVAANYQRNEDIHVRVVNVYQALTGKLQEREDVLQASGIQDVHAFIAEITGTWKKSMSKKFTDDFHHLLKRLYHKIEEKQEEIKLSRRDLRKRQRQQEREIEDMISSNQEIIDRVNGQLRQYEFEIRSFAEEQGRIQGENLRNEMRRITGSRVVDGDLLSKAFQEVQQDLAMNVLEELNIKLYEMQKKLELELGKLQAQEVDSSFMNYEGFYREESVKFEKGLVPAINIAGGLGGIAAGFAIGGPIGAVAAIGISLFSSWIGRKTKDYIQDERAKASMKDLEQPIQKFQQNLQQSITNEIDTFMKYTQEVLQQYIAQQEQKLSRVREEHRRDLHLSENELLERRQEIDADLAYIQQMEVTA